MRPLLARTSGSASWISPLVAIVEHRQRIIPPAHPGDIQRYDAEVLVVTATGQLMTVYPGWFTIVGALPDNWTLADLREPDA